MIKNGIAAMKAEFTADGNDPDDVDEMVNVSIHSLVQNQEFSMAIANSVILQSDFGNSAAPKR